MRGRGRQKNDSKFAADEDVVAPRIDDVRPVDGQLGPRPGPPPGVGDDSIFSSFLSQV
jgi:hypothetical protein